MEWTITIRATGDPEDAKQRVSSFLAALDSAGHAINAANFSQQGTADLAAPIIKAKIDAEIAAEAIAIKP